MTWGRLPLTVWSWLVGALLTMLAFSVLFAAVALLLCDRHAGTSFFVPANGVVNGMLVNAHGHDGSPLLWLHLFWFFGHPVVYIAVLPGMGLASMLLANFSRRRVPGYASDDRDHARHRSAGNSALGTSHVRRRAESLRGQRIRRNDDGHCDPLLQRR